MRSSSKDGKPMQAGTNQWCDGSPYPTCIQGDAIMAGILLWLMGVPLIVIVLLYLLT
jgi:hypothetical protein